MRTTNTFILFAVAGVAAATLPPPTDEAKAHTAETRARTEWSDKVAAYKTCLAMDRTAEGYRRSLQANGQTAPAPLPTPPCTDPGAFVSPVASGTARPLEAAGAHSPPETSAGPPSSTKPQSDKAKTPAG